MWPTGMALHHHLAAAGDGREQFLAFACLQPAHQMGGAAIDETAGQAFVQGVGQHVLDLARAAPANAAASATQSERAAM